MLKLASFMAASKCTQPISRTEVPSFQKLPDIKAIQQFLDSIQTPEEKTNK